MGATAEKRPAVRRVGSRDAATARRLALNGANRYHPMSRTRQPDV
jgi:hypothetical protein